MKQFLIALLAVSASVCFADAETKIPFTIASGGQFYFLQPAKQVAYGAVARASASSDGRFMTYILDPELNRDPLRVTDQTRRDFDRTPGNKSGLYVFDRVSQQSHMLFALNDPQQHFNNAYWIEGSSILAIDMHAGQDEFTTSIYDPVSKRQFNLPSTSSPSSRELYYIKKSNAFICINYSWRTEGKSAQTIEIFDSRFKLVRNYAVPANVRFTTAELVNDRLITYKYNQSIRKHEAFEFELQTSNFLPVDESLQFRIDENLLFLFPSRDGLALVDGKAYMESMTKTNNLFKSENVDTIALEKIQTELASQSLIVTKDGEDGAVMGKNSAVWHSSRSGLFISDLLTLNEDQYRALLLNRVKTETMSRAKQVGTAMMIYGADYDDALPMAQGWQEALQPYMRNSSLTEGFVYMMNGEIMSEINDITGTILGFIETPYGTAYVRGDSSVVWKDKPKPVAYLRSLEALRT